LINHLSIPIISGKKSSEKISYPRLGDRGTYKQALRGLFTTGTSSTPCIRRGGKRGYLKFSSVKPGEQREKVGGKQGLKS